MQILMQIIFEHFQKCTSKMNTLNCLILPCATAEETITACKNAEKYAISTLIFFNDPHTGEGLRRTSPDPTPLGAPALRAYAPRSGPSVRPLGPPFDISKYTTDKAHHR